MSTSISLATFSLQCNGTAAGLWTRCGTASGLVCIFMGGPCVSGIFCLLQTLKALLLKYYFIQSSKCCLFCIVAGNGTFCGAWTCSLVGHEHGRGLSGSHSPSGCLAPGLPATTTWPWVADQTGSLSRCWLPPTGTCGKVVGSVPSFVMVVLLRRQPPFLKI